MNIIHKTQTALQEMFRNFKKEVSFSGVTFAKVVYKNDVEGSKQEGGKKLLQKVTEVVITLGSNYEDKVNRILEGKQDMTPEFQAEKMNGKFYKYGFKTPIVANIKNHDFEMLVMIIENKQKPLRKSTYFHNGQEITIERAKELNLLRDSFFTKKGTSGRGLIDEKFDFDFHTLGFDKIQSITLNKTKIVVVD